jgi:hypothetical protein
MAYPPGHTEPSESMKKFLNDYCYAGICWVCGAPLKEKGAIVCLKHKNDVPTKKEQKP